MAIKIKSNDQAAPISQEVRNATQTATQADPVVTPDKPPKGRQGFASMPEEKRREIASRGGKSTAPDKRYFSNPENARLAGIRGGQAKSQKAKS
jgi:general stress protein YciG